MADPLPPPPAPPSPDIKRYNSDGTVTRATLEYEMKVYNYLRLLAAAINGLTP